MTVRSACAARGAKTPRRFLWWLVALMGLAAAFTSRDMFAGQAPPTADYARDVLPILEANCVRCHSPAQREGGLLLDTYEDLVQGGDSGKAIAPGDAAGSRLVAMIEGRAKKKMPPKSDLRPDEIATVRAWIDAGARYSEIPVPSLDDRVPVLAQQGAVLPQVTGLAFRPGGRELAIGGYREVRRIVPTGTGNDKPFTGLHDIVRAVAYSPDGTWLAAGGGVPGSFGEIAIFDAASGMLRHTLRGHRDYVYQVAISHDGKRLASCGYDKSVRVWDVESGRVLSVLREHTDAVFAVAFSADDQWIASGAGDRSVKIWDAQKGSRMYTLTDATEAITTLQFQPGVVPRLTAAGNDKTIRTWAIDAQGGKQVRSVIAHTTPVLAVRYSPDGTLLASAASDRTVKIWRADTWAEIRTLERQRDWPQALEWSPDGRTLAVGRYDGTVSLYDSATGKRTGDPIRPAAPAGQRHTDQ
jgi:WD40 repeat protein/mono/diheme cytochrome c family protein